MLLDFCAARSLLRTSPLILSHVTSKFCTVSTFAVADLQTIFQTQRACMYEYVNDLLGYQLPRT
jgi:hypothetical protein